MNTVQSSASFALICMAPIFLVLLPLFFSRLGARLDQWLQWRPILDAPFNLILGWLLILPAWLFAFWSIYSQFTIGRGTPVPLMATQKLIVQPPYTYCRNPMALGAIRHVSGCCHPISFIRRCDPGASFCWLCFYSISNALKKRKWRSASVRNTWHINNKRRF